MRWTIRAAVLVQLGRVVLAPEAHAQSVRGIVSDRATGGPLSGVVVTLLDEAGMGRTRSLTNEAGEYRVMAPAPGTYRLRTLRIGFQPVVSEPMTLGPGSDVRHSISLATIPFSLDTIRVAAKSSCEGHPDEAQATLRVWEQVRAAVTAAELTAHAVHEARVVTYERALEPLRERVVRQKTSVSSGLTLRPWSAVPLDSLRRAGYVVHNLDGSTSYYAPDLEVLASDEFIADHCLQVVRARGDDNRLGVSFEPTKERRRVPGISGTLWLDVKTSELRDLEFRYANVSRDQTMGRPGGSMRFVRMKNGAWMIARWDIRMPELENRMVRVAPGRGMEQETRLREIRVEGGELALVTRGDDTLWARPTLHLRGRVTDSASGRPVPNAMVTLRGTTLGDSTSASGDFAIADVLPGEYLVEVSTPDLDRLGSAYTRPFTFVDSTTTLSMEMPDARSAARQLCPDTATGIIAGRVRGTGAMTALANVLVTAEWTDPADTSSGVKWVETRTSDRGRYALCGVSRGRPVSLRILSDSGGAPERSLTIPVGERFVAADFVVDRSTRDAVFRGLVLSATNAQPMGSVEVVLDSLRRNAYTDDRGRFLMHSVPPGTHLVTIRRVGYQPMTEHVTFAATRNVERQYALRPVATLEAVEVRANPLMRSFEEHRAVGLGFFLTRADLEKWTTMHLSSVLSRATSSRIVTGGGRKATIVSSRVMPTGREVFGGRDDRIACGEGFPCACYPQVYVNNMLMNPGRPTPPWDISEWSAERVEAIEWYSSRIHMPLKYNTRQAECGVLVIHLRQFEPRGPRDSTRKPRE